MFRIANPLRALAIGAACVGAAASLHADDLSDAFAARVLKDDVTIGHYLQLDKNEGAAAIESTSLLKTADLNGDGTRDYALSAYANGACAIALYVAKPGAEASEARYAGYVKIDADYRASVRASDVTGDKCDELRAESLRTYENGRIVKTLNVIKLGADGKATRIFRTILDSVEREGIYRQRITSLVKIEDVDGDGRNDIRVTTRKVDTVEDKAQRKERELSLSLETIDSVFSMESASSYTESQCEVKAPSAEALLSVARELHQLGAETRARIIATGIIESGSLGSDLLAEAQVLASLPASDTVTSTESATVSKPAGESKQA